MRDAGLFALQLQELMNKDWRAEGYPEDVLERVFHKNAERFLAECGYRGTI